MSSETVFIQFKPPCSVIAGLVSCNVLYLKKYGLIMKYPLFLHLLVHMCTKCKTTPSSLKTNSEEYIINVETI